MFLKHLKGSIQLEGTLCIKTDRMKILTRNGCLYILICPGSNLEFIMYTLSIMLFFIKEYLHYIYHIYKPTVHCILNILKVIEDVEDYTAFIYTMPII